MLGYICIAGTLLFTVYGQLILKWRLNHIYFKLPEGILNKFACVIKIIFDPYIFSSFFSAFIASLFWIVAMTKFEITKAYPFMSLAPALVFLFGVLMLGEEFTLGKLVGLVFIILGVFISMRY